MVRQAISHTPPDGTWAGGCDDENAERKCGAVIGEMPVVRRSGQAPPVSNCVMRWSASSSVNVCRLRDVAMSRHDLSTRGRRGG